MHENATWALELGSKDLRWRARTLPTRREEALVIEAAPTGAPRGGEAPGDVLLHDLPRLALLAGGDPGPGPLQAW